MGKKTKQSPKKQEQKLEEKKEVAVVEEKIVTKAPIVNKVVDSAVVDQIIDKKHIEVHQQNVVTEIHEQPIIEIHEKPVTAIIKEDSVFKKASLPERLEEIEAPPMQEKELLEDALLLAGKKETIAIEERDIKQIKEKEFIKRVEIQPVVELHVQPHITEVHEQKVVELIQQPITRVVHEKPIIKRVVDSPGQVETEVITQVKAIKMDESLLAQKNVEKELLKEAQAF